MRFIILAFLVFHTFSVVISEAVLDGRVPEDSSGKLDREKRQLGLGNILNPGGNQNQGRRGPTCQTPKGQRGKCLSIEQCVLKELDDDYIKNKGFLCLMSVRGPVGACCPDSVQSPVVYRPGMFGNKNTVFARTDNSDDTSTPSTPQDVELL